MKYLTKLFLDKWHCFGGVCRTFNYKNVSRNLHLTLEEKKKIKSLRKWYKSKIIKNIKLGNIEKQLN